MTITTQTARFLVDSMFISYFSPILKVPMKEEGTKILHMNSISNKSILLRSGYLLFFHKQLNLISTNADSR